ncbi:DUF3040 domain-containing protein [Nonomuraea longispora]|uniref:DUF3040 domain-containing protein n=2 Tax=Nonomuraea longispora TaxID=1848320 RepID=A0A4R4NL82_9ACTN|nr:DUF3040 domain-containing protein [Nonomuraea longispora]
MPWRRPEIMAMSRDERRALAQIEKQLAHEDPVLDKLLAGPRGRGGEPDPPRGLDALSTQAVVLWALAAATSVVLVLAVAILLSYQDFSGTLRPSPTAIPFNGPFPGPGATELNDQMS